MKVKSTQEDSHYICLSEILNYSVFKIGKNHYLQVILGKFKYIYQR